MTDWIDEYNSDRRRDRTYRAIGNAFVVAAGLLTLWFAWLVYTEGTM